MSQENVEIVRQVVDAYNARDTDRFLGLIDPEIEFRSVFERKTYRGLAGRTLTPRWKDSTARTTASWMRAKIASCTCIASLAGVREAASL